MAVLDPEKDEFFRASVGIMLIDGLGQVLALRRADRPGQWQMPQGGLERRDHSLRAAAERELEEETGITSDQIEFVAEHPGWLSYELPKEHRSLKTGRGQTQKWLLYRCRGGARPEIDLTKTAAQEFDDFQWLNFAGIVEGVVAFREPVYRQLGEDFAEHLG